MALQNIQNHDMNLVLSTDPKPRLKWTPELHQRFVDAVAQLGGPEKATPKSLMRVMGIHGLTLYHLKSHLQKFRLGKSQPSPTYNETEQEEYIENQRSVSGDYGDGNGTHNQNNETLQIAQALQMQMEVQRKLHEQIEVQRHLQLRIEAQGKYLQSVLRKAQDTLAGYNSSALEVETAKAELSQLVSMVDSGCPSSSLSVLTEMEGLKFKKTEKKPIGCSLESSLTSSESSGRKEDTKLKSDNDDTNEWNGNGNGNASVLLSLMEMNAGEKSGTSNYVSATRKRSRSTISDGDCVEQVHGKRGPPGHREKQELSKFGLTVKFDLNSQYQNDFDSGPSTIDLNCKEVEQFNDHL